MGGLYTTVEGLLQKIREHLSEDNPFVTGDSADPTVRTRFVEFLTKLDQVVSGSVPFTLIVNDALSNSWIESENPDNDPYLEVIIVYSSLLFALFVCISISTFIYTIY